jgi:glycerol-3-phosphate acyltransferase PlsY
MIEALAIAGAYALGCCTAGYYLVRLRTAQDIRRTGSGSAGATNVGRVLGVPGFAATLLADAGKGVAVVLLARRLGLDSTATVLAMVGVLAGHIWPVQLGFRGGKGVATYLGAVLCFEPWWGVVLAGLALVLGLALRQWTLAGLGAMAALPLVLLLRDAPPSTLVGLALLAALILIAHRANIREEMSRLLAPDGAKGRPASSRDAENA